MNKIKLIEVRSEIAAGTRGASLGIDALRIASLGFNSDFFTRFDEIEVEVENKVVYKAPENPNAKYIKTEYTVLQNVCEAVKKVRTQDKVVPLILAGDHSTAAGTIAGLKSAQPEKRLGVIWIDAHADLHTPYTTPSGNMHGMPLAIAAGVDNLEAKVNNPEQETVEFWNKIKAIGFDAPKIELEDLIFVAVRDTEAAEELLMKKHGIKNFTVKELREKGVSAVIQEAMDKLTHCENIYVSFDVDSMDSGISMGTGTPVANGLTVDEAIDLNQGLIAHKKVCAWEMVEVNPTLDRENIMAKNAFKVLEATTDSLIENF